MATDSLNRRQCLGRVVIHDNATGLSQTDVGPISVSHAETTGGGVFFTGSNGEYKPGSILALVVVIGALALALGDD